MNAVYKPKPVYAPKPSGKLFAVVMNMRCLAGYELMASSEPYASMNKAFFNALDALKIAKILTYDQKALRPAAIQFAEQHKFDYAVRNPVSSGHGTFTTLANDIGVAAERTVFVECEKKAIDAIRAEGLTICVLDTPKASVDQPLQYPENYYDHVLEAVSKLHL